jgi:hypothetical protein
MNEIHDTMRISQFLNPQEKEIVDDNEVIHADIVLAHSVDESRAYETDEDD